MLKNAIWLFAVTIIVLLVFLPSYSQFQDLKQKNADFSRKIHHLTRENAQLKEEKRRLEEDPVYLEKVAREKMGLVRPGEVVYRITPVNQEVEKKGN